MVRPSIITGMEALGRGHDLNRLLMFGRIVADTLGPEVFSQVINPSDFIQRVGTNLGIDVDGLVKTEQQLAANQQQAQMQQLIDRLGPELIKQANEQGNTQ